MQALGSVCFVVLFLIEIFGPPLIRNCEIILALLIAYAVAAFVRYDGKKYVASGEITAAPNGIFFWVSQALPIAFVAAVLQR